MRENSTNSVTNDREVLSVYASIYAVLGDKGIPFGLGMGSLELSCKRQVKGDSLRTGRTVGWAGLGKSC